MYVQIMGISEDVFWNCDIAFVRTVANNKAAFDKWMTKQQELKDKERNGRKK